MNNQYLIRPSADHKYLEQHASPQSSSTLKKNARHAPLPNQQKFKYFAFSLFVIISIICVNCLYDHLQKSENNVRSANESIAVIRSQVEKNEKPVTAKENLVHKLKLDPLVIVPPVRQAPQRLTNKQKENDPAVEDIPESGQFTLLSDAKKSASTDVRLLGEN